jgi:hypothetical protein
MRTNGERDEMGRASDEAGIESTITVHMRRGRVVLRPVGRLDRDLIDTVLGLLSCARDAGVIAEVDLAAIEPGELAGRDVLTELTAAPTVGAGRPAAHR